MEIVKSPKQRFFDQNYRDKNQILHLQMQCSKELLHLAFFDPSQKKIVGFEEYNLGNHEHWNQAIENLRHIFNQDDFPKNCKSYSIAIIDKQYTLIPHSLFDKDHAWKYLELNHSLKNDGSISIHHLSVDSKAIEIVYALDVKLELLLDEYFPEIRKLHYTAPLLESLFLYNSSEHELQVHLQENSFDLLYLKNNQLQILNTFPYYNEEDFLYYLLFVMEQLKLDRENIDLKMSGNIDKNSKLFEMTSTYIKHPIIQERNKDLKFSNIFNDLPSSKYSNLFNQFLCE